MMAKVIGGIVAAMGLMVLAVALALVPSLVAAWVWVSGVNQTCATAFNNPSLLLPTFGDVFAACVFLVVVGHAAIPATKVSKK